MNNTRQAESRKTAAPGLSRQRARTEATRKKLLAAAEKTFARDGFEAARLEDIASLAGYTRGAFYANFKSKEDIFFALLEEWVGRRIAEVSAVLARENTPAKRLRALRNHYAQIAKDRRLALLSLEFKLFAIRHPEADVAGAAGRVDAELLAQPSHQAEHLLPRGGHRADRDPGRDRVRQQHAVDADSLQHAR